MNENNTSVKNVPKKRMIMICAIVAACLVLCAAGYLIYRSSLPVLELVDFPKEYTESCELGSVYGLKTTVTDVDGNEYSISAKVNTTDGEVVGIFGKNFDVADMEGYIVEYTAKIPGSRTQRSRLTLTVEDKTEPNIRINVPETAYVGTSYELPKFVTYDMADSQITAEPKLYYMLGEEKQEIEITCNDGVWTFIPQQRGIYEYVVTASKENGTEKQASAAITAKLPGEVFYIEEAALEYVASRTGNGQFEFKAENAGDEVYSGAYISYTASGYSDWDSMKLKLSLKSDSYSEYAYVDIPIYFAADKDVTFSILNNDAYKKTYTPNKWHIISVKREDFVRTMNSGQELLPVKFNCVSENFTNLSEVRLGTITAREAGEYQIEAPKVSGGKAGQSLRIPSAGVTKSGEKVDTVAAAEKKFINGFGKISEISGNTYTPASAGTIVVTYQYKGAEDVTLEIPVTCALAANEVYNPLGATSKNTVSRTGKGSFEVKAGDASDSVYSGAYVSYTASGYNDWDSTYLKLDLNSGSYAAYDYIDVYLYFNAKGDCTFSILDNKSYEKQYAANQWHKITVSRADFIAKMTTEKPDLIPVKFNAAGNFVDLTEVRIGMITAREASDYSIKAPEITDVAVGQSFQIPKADVVKGKTAITQIKAATVKFVDGFENETVITKESYTPAVAGKFVLTYTYDNAETVTKEITVSYSLKEDEVYNPLGATSKNTVSRTGKGSFEVKEGDASDSVYSEAYVSYTAPGYNSWDSGYLKLGLNADSYADYDYMDIYIYFKAEGKCTFSVLNNEATYKKEYAANQWHKITVSRADFISKMTTEKPELIPVKFNAAGGNFPNLTEVRIGKIVARKASVEIKEPNTTAAVVNQAYTIPSAQVVRGTTAITTIKPSAQKFVDGFGKETEVSGDSYTPAVAGKFVLTYTYDNAETVTKEIPVNYTLAANEVFSPLGADSAKVTSNHQDKVKYQVKAGDALDTVYSGAYVSITAPGYNSWSDIYLNKLTKDAYNAYDLVDIPIYLAENAGASTSTKIPSKASQQKTYAANQWHIVTMAREDFVKLIETNGALTIYSVKFNSTGNFANLTEVRIGTITARKAEKYEIKKPEVTTVKAGQTFAIPEADVTSSGVVLDAVKASEVKFVDGFGNESVVSKESCIPLAAGKLILTYKYEGAETVTKEITVNYTLAANEVFSPMAADSVKVTSNHQDKVKYQVKSGDASDTVYSGAYVSITAPGYNSWSDIYLNKLTAENYTEFDYIDIPIYLAENTGASTSTKIPSKASQEKTYAANQWHIVTMTRADFVKLIEKNGAMTLYSVKFNSIGNFANLTEVRVGTITGRKTESNTVNIMSLDGKTKEPAVVNMPIGKTFFQVIRKTKDWFMDFFR